MFSKQTRHPSIRETLALAGVPSAAQPAGLTVLERMGTYSGRRVNFFRAFDPARATARAIEDLVLGSGHVEHEGLVMLDGRPEAEGAAPNRAPADRAVHADDERFVFQHGSARL
jgi:hypothetical protein